MLTARAAAFLAEIRGLDLPPLWQTPVDQTRASFEKSVPALFGEPPVVASVTDQTVDGVPIRVYMATEHAAPGALIYMHGGGWVVGSIRSHDSLCRALAARSHQAVVSVGYRLAPEHPFPAAIEDAWTVTRWASGRWENLAVGGDSAGGQLAASVALRARDADLALRLQALIYPVTNHNFETGSYAEFGDLETLTEAEMRWFWSTYMAAGAGLPETDHSPLRAIDFTGLAPALVITAECDLLRDDGEAYAERLRSAGVETTLHRYAGMIHGFIRMPAVLDQASTAIDEVAHAVESACTGAAPPVSTPGVG